MPDQKAFVDLYPSVNQLQFEFVNPLAGLGMIIIGMFLVLLGYWVYGLTPIAVGIGLALLYRRHLMEILGGAY
jgi:hypothetical protein